jgi:hypothetical protein
MEGAREEHEKGTKMEVSELDGISIKQVLDDGDTRGLSIYSDGTRGYWGEGDSPTLYVKPDGTRWTEEVCDWEDEMSPYHRLALFMGDKYDWDDSTDRQMTRDEYIEYLMVDDNITREEAETYLNEIEYK